VLSEKEKRAIGKAPTTDAQAYDFYLRGRQFFHQFRRKGFDFARQMFERAIEIDPRYSRAYAGVADCCSFLYMYYDASQANLQGADSASRTALDLDPDLADAHASRGLAVSLSKRYPEAEQEFKIAIRLNPKLFEAHYFFARACFQQGKMAEAAELFEQASRVNPDDYQAPSLLALAYDGLGRKAEALAAYRRSLRICEKHLELHPDDGRALYIGAGSLCQIGQNERAAEWATRALAMDPEDPTVLYNVGFAFSVLGKIEESVECLEKAVERGMGQKEWFENDPDLNAVRTHPRFQVLLSRLQD
ncbi:MAG: tetratricopeptide repeat protein, partial [Terriglobales bacterium]